MANLKQVKSMMKHFADKAKKGIPTRSRDVDRMDTVLDKARGDNNYKKGRSSQAVNLSHKLDALRKAIQSSITASKNPIQDVDQLTVKQMKAIQKNPGAFIEGTYVVGKGKRTNVESLTGREKTKHKKIVKEIPDKIEESKEMHYWEKGHYSQDSTNDNYGKWVESPTYMLLHPGSIGRPNQGVRERVKNEKKTRAAIRHLNHLENYAATHPIHEIPVYINGVQYMVPTSHRYLEGMEIENGHLKSQVFSYKTMKQYNYGLNKDQKDYSSAITAKVTNRIETNIPAKESNPMYGGFKQGAYANMAKDLYKVKKVIDLDKKFGGKK